MRGEYFPSGNISTLVIIGCTCGLSAAFNTPIGGILYAMEEYKGCLAASNVLTTLIVMASLCSVICSRVGFEVKSTDPFATFRLRTFLRHFQILS